MAAKQLSSAKRHGAACLPVTKLSKAVKSTQAPGPQCGAGQEMAPDRDERRRDLLRKDRT